MGGKEDSERMEEDYHWALGILCEAKAIDECEIHGTYFGGTAPVEEAYRLLDRCIKSGELKLEKGETRCSLTDLIKSVYDDNSGTSSCQVCDKNFGPD
jgi:hypothetical protein